MKENKKNLFWKKIQIFLVEFIEKNNVVISLRF